jgi:Tol biopolymer transport system component
VYDLDGREQPVRLTYEGDNRYPIWSQDGERVVFVELLPGETRIFGTPADGTQLEPELLQSAEGVSIPWSLSPDGKELFYLLLSVSAAIEDIWVFPLEKGGTLRPWLDSQFKEIQPMVSPRGDLIAYVSDRSGRYEVWVRSCPDPEAMRPIQISNNGGFEPVWSKDGRELFYREGNELKAVSIAREPALRFGEPQTLFQAPLRRESRGETTYDVAPDGRFIALLDASEESACLVVVENWFEELKRLAPTN